MRTIAATTAPAIGQRASAPTTSGPSGSSATAAIVERGRSRVNHPLRTM